MADASHKHVPAGALTRILGHAAIIVAIGSLIGVADANFRPIKLGRTGVVAFEDPSGPGATQPAKVEGSGEQTGSMDAPDAKTSGSPPDVPEVAAQPAQPTQPPTPPVAGDGVQVGFKFTPKDQLKPGHITVEEAKRAFDSGSASFVDARTKAKYEEGHVVGAIRLELADFASGPPAKLGLLPRENTIVVYCGGGDCDESERVAERLEGFGYARIFIVHDGFPGWQAAGHDVETGPEEFE